MQRCIIWSTAMAYHAIKVTMHIHIEASLEKYAEGSRKKKLPRDLLTFHLVCYSSFVKSFTNRILIQQISLNIQ